MFKGYLFIVCFNKYITLIFHFRSFILEKALYF